MLYSSLCLLTRASCRHCQPGPPPGRMLGYAAVIHLLQLALEICHTHTHTLTGKRTHTYTHLLDKLLPGAAEGAGLVCTEQMYETGGKK